MARCAVSGGKKRMAWTDGTFPLWIFHDTREQYARITSVAYFIFVLLSCLSVAIIVGLSYPTRNRDTCMGHSTNDTTNELYYRMQWHQWCGIINLNPVIRLAVGGRTTVFAISVLLHCIVSYFMASPFFAIHLDCLPPLLIFPLKLISFFFIYIHSLTIYARINAETFDLMPLYSERTVFHCTKCE